MSTVTTIPAESGGLAPDPAVVPTRGAGAKKMPILLGVMTAVLAVILLRSPHSGETTFELAAPNDFIQLPDIVVPSMLTAWLMVAVCAVLTAETVRRMLAAGASRCGWPPSSRWPG